MHAEFQNKTEKRCTVIYMHINVTAEPEVKSVFKQKFLHSL